jgi:hypothetical protein
MSKRGRNRSRLWPFWTLALGLLLLSAIVFRDFLFGDSLLVYKDAGSDSVNDYYPSFVLLSDYVRSHGFPSWSFTAGMGQDLSYLAGYFVLEPVTLLPKELIASALVFQHLAKVFLTGLLFFGFLQLRGLKPVASCLGSLLVSFSAYMCMGACWYPLADEVFCFSGLLFAIELALKRGLWFVFVPVVALIGVIDAFHLYLCAVFLLLYVPLRLFGQYGWAPSVVLRISLQLAAAAALGVCIAAVFVIPSFYAMLNSPRGSGPGSLFAHLRTAPLFGLESSLHYITAALRCFSNDILGTAEDFRGWHNYLEAPLTYCGLPCLILLPQVFVGASRRHRRVYGLFLGGVILLTLFPWFRYLFWAFQGDYYRAFSLFTVLGAVALTAVVFSRYSQGRVLNLWLLAATTIVLLAILFLPVSELQGLIDPALKLQATIFLVCYGGVLVAGQLLGRAQLASYLILGICLFELVLFDRISVSHRSTVTKSELKARTGYNDESLDTIRDIKVSDNNTFYRVTKIRSSSPGVLPSLNDALVFGYYGTSYYSSFNNLNYISFLVATEAIRLTTEMDTRYSLGLLNDPMLALFAAEKYAVVEDPAFLRELPQYEFIRQHGRDYLFRNALFLPLGLSFDRYISEDTFRTIVKRQKADVLLNALVVSNEAEAEKFGLKPIDLSELAQAIETSSLREIVETRRQTGLTVTSFEETQIEGNITTGKNSVLVVQTPFDRGWQAWQDGKPARTLKVDAGLLGVALESGQHKIELRYQTPFRNLGLAITASSVLILIVAAWRWPRLAIAPAA